MTECKNVVLGVCIVHGHNDLQKNYYKSLDCSCFRCTVDQPAVHSKKVFVTHPSTCLEMHVKSASIMCKLCDILIYWVIKFPYGPKVLGFMSLLYYSKCLVSSAWVGHFMGTGSLFCDF